jgi:putative inorganic carbon (hco3(-)) transporter
VDFALFILVTAILFIRPGDFVPGLESVPLYLIAIVPCLLLSWHKLTPQLTTAALRERPVLVFGIGILLVSVVSNVAYRRFEVGFDFVVAFAKVLIFYLLMLAHVDTPRRLKLFLACLVGIILIPILLAVLNYHGYINLGFEGTKDWITSGPEPTEIKRLGTSGNFGDPNDVCEIVNCAMIFSLCGLLDRGGGCTRVFWLAPLAIFGHALALTQSRGGFLGAVVGLMVLFRSRFRGMTSLALGGMTLALMFVWFGGRQTSLSTSEGTGQGRIQLWNVGFALMVRSPVAPLIGIGCGGFVEHTAHVAHNAFIGTYVDLGFLGGTLLFGQYFFCLKNLKELGSKRVTLPDPEMRCMQPFIMASMASFATSEMSITNPFSLVTYVALGLATVFIRLANPSPPLPDLRLNRKLIRRVIRFSGLFLLSLYVFVWLFRQ